MGDQIHLINAMIRFISLIVVTLLPLPSVLAQRRNCPKIATPASQHEQQQSANDFWAKALWLSLPVNDASDKEIAANFTAALTRAKCKAPIYVSFGDTDSGPSRIRQKR